MKSKQTDSYFGKMSTMQEMINQLMVSAKLQIPLQLGELNVNLRFVETHWRDIKQILETSSGDTLC